MPDQYTVVEVDGQRVLQCLECRCRGGDHSEDCPFIRRSATLQQVMDDAEFDRQVHKQ